MHVLWDLDGTIVDTIPSLVDTFCILASEYHGIETDRALVDELTRVKSEVLFAHYNIPYDEANIALFRDINSQIDVESMALFEGVEEILKRTKTNYLVTNRNRKSTEQILHHLNIHHYFKEIVCVDDGFPRKPALDSYRYMFNKYPVDMVIGDRTIDFIPAEPFNVQTCVFRNKDVEAGIYIENYREITTMFDE